MNVIKASSLFVVGFAAEVRLACLSFTASRLSQQPFLSTLRRYCITREFNSISYISYVMFSLIALKICRQPVKRG